MGVQDLMKLLHEKAPACVKEVEMKTFFGRTVAIDASMSIYQFLIAMKMASEAGVVEMANEDGAVTSHLLGLWSRTLRMVSEGIRPVYVFDGAPPEMKRKELEERKARAAQAQVDLEAAIEQGDAEVVEKMSKRTVRVTKEQTGECKKLLQLMGLPVVEAATEAEAQCCELVRAGKAWAVASDDMDSLTFGGEVVLRHLSYSEAKKRPIYELHLKSVLESLELTRDQFIDLCILLGCDYCPRIPGIGMVKAFEAIKKHKTIEKVIENLDTKKYPLPDPYPFAEARKLFQNPEVVKGEDVEVAFRAPDEQGLHDFLVNEKQFQPERVASGIEKLKRARVKKAQSRLDAFFKVTAPSVAATNKRKLEEMKAAKKRPAKLQKTNSGKKAVIKK